jgi:hypothetical protein
MPRDFAAELLEAVEHWKNTRVAVRLVAANDELVAVFSGRLGPRSAEKGESLFWPVELDGDVPATLERPGIYAHPDHLSEVRVHVGEFVVEFTQAGVTVNMRRLEPRDS